MRLWQRLKIPVEVVEPVVMRLDLRSVILFFIFFYSAALPVFAFELGFAGASGNLSLRLSDVFNDNILLADDGEIIRDFTTEVTSGIALNYKRNRQSFSFSDNLYYVFLPSLPGDSENYYTHLLQVSATQAFMNNRLIMSVAEMFSQEPLRRSGSLLHGDLIGAMNLDLPGGLADLNGEPLDFTRQAGEVSLSDIERQIKSETTNTNRLSAEASFTRTIIPRLESKLTYRIMRLAYQDTESSDRSEQNAVIGLTGLLSRLWNVSLEHEYSLARQTSGLVVRDRAAFDRNFQITQLENRLLDRTDRVTHRSAFTLRRVGLLHGTWDQSVYYEHILDVLDPDNIRRHSIRLDQSFKLSPLFSVNSSLGYTFLPSLNKEVIGNFALLYRQSRELFWRMWSVRRLDVSNEGEVFNSIEGNISQEYSERMFSFNMRIFIRQDDSESGNGKGLIRGISNSILLFPLERVLFARSRFAVFEWLTSVTQTIFRDEDLRSTLISSEISFSHKLSRWFFLSASFRRQLFRNDTGFAINGYKNNIYSLTLRGVA